MTIVTVVGDAKEANRRRNSKYIASPKGKETRKAYYESIKSTPRYRYTHARKGAIKRGVAWEFTFEEWWRVWESSGHWLERGPTGYNMCRYGDEGPYSVNNVYIAHHAVNKKDAWYNGKISHPPIGARKGKKYPNERRSLRCL